MIRSPLTKRLLRIVLTVLLTLALMCTFFLAVIMGQPQPGPEGAAQPLPSPLAAGLRIASGDHLNDLLSAFPAPMMAAMNTHALLFVQGDVADVPFEDGVARVATLLYATQDGQAVTVQSIYPARAIGVLGKNGLTISGNAGQPLAGLPSIRMDSESLVRMHAQGEEALYAVTMPAASSAAMRQITSAMQLYQSADE